MDSVYTDISRGLLYSIVELYLLPSCLFRLQRMKSSFVGNQAIKMALIQLFVYNTYINDC